MVVYHSLKFSRSRFSYITGLCLQQLYINFIDFIMYHLKTREAEDRGVASLAAFLGSIFLSGISTETSGFNIVEKTFELSSERNKVVQVGDLSPTSADHGRVLWLQWRGKQVLAKAPLLKPLPRDWQWSKIKWVGLLLPHSQIVRIAGYLVPLS